MFTTTPPCELLYLLQDPFKIDKLLVDNPKYEEQFIVYLNITSFYNYRKFERRVKGLPSSESKIYFIRTV